MASSSKGALPASVQSAILGFLPPEAPQKKKEDVCWYESWRTFAERRGPVGARRDAETLPALDRPLPEAAVEAVLRGRGYAVVDDFLGRDVGVRVLEACEAAKSELRAARVGKGRLAARDASTRNDVATFLAETDASVSLALREAELRLRLARAQVAPFALDSRRASTQLACYDQPGARYARHADVREDDAYGTNEPRRFLTAIYYCNLHPVRGGRLRVFFDDDDGEESDAFVDVEPLFDRLVVFRSALEHEVLPTFSRRFALTQWWYRESPRPPLLRRVPAVPRREEKRIFVSIAAYRDADVVATVRAMLEAAAEPESVVAGVVLQYDSLGGRDDAWVRDLVKNEDQVRIRFVDYRDAAGPCPARAAAQELFRDEEYFLQIDAHTRFVPQWDSLLVAALHEAERSSSRVVLTTYPMDFADQGDARPTILAPLRFDEDGVLRFSGRVLSGQRSAPLPSPAWCAGFNFARGDVVRRVPYDPHFRFLFFGEELAMAARLYTHGYDFFAPPRAVLYHQWSRRGRPDFARDARTVRFGPHNKESWTRRRATSLRRLFALLGLEEMELYVGPDLHRFGLGTERTLADYEARLGVTFRDRVVRPGAQNAGLPADAFAPAANTNASDVLALLAKTGF